MRPGTRRHPRLPVRAPLRLRGARAAVAMLAVALLSACSTVGLDRAPRSDAGTVIVPVLPQPGAPVSPAASGRTLAMAPWADARAGRPGRAIGVLEAPVFGVHDPRLVLAEDPAKLMADAVARRLEGAGLGLVAPSAPADLRLEASLNALRMDVGARDARRIGVHARLFRAGDSQPVWAGELVDVDERFAGVIGNNRRDLEQYLGAGMGAVADQLAAQVLRQLQALPAAAPMRPAAGAAVSAPQPQLQQPQQPQPQPQPQPTAGGAAGEGRIAIASAPPRVKVYVDDVYHGLTPLTVILPQGVHQLHFRREGCDAQREKVAVRAGATVELELSMTGCAGAGR